MSSAQSRATARGTFNQEFVSIGLGYWWLLILCPLLVGAVTYGVVAFALPHKYASEALLNLDRGKSRSMEALMFSPPLVEEALSGLVDAKTPEAKMRHLAKNWALSDIEPGGDRAAARLFRLSITDGDPSKAQTISSRLLDAWIRSTRPGPDARTTLDAEYQALKGASQQITDLIKRMNSETSSLLAPNSLSGELATPLSTLIAKRDDQLNRMRAIEVTLAGTSRDVIVSPPHLPQEPMERRAGAYAVLAAALALPLIFIALVFYRRCRPA